MFNLKIILKLVFLMGLSGNALAAGFLQVDGEVTEAAIVGKVKAVRCDTQLFSSGIGLKKNSCDFKKPYLLELNQSYALPQGLYLVGYENSIYPGLVEIRDDQSTHLKLNQVSISAEFAGKQVALFRDFSHPIEQKKIMLTHFGLGRSFFLMTENEGEFQLRIPFFKEVLAHIDYEGCGLVTKRAAKESTFRVERKDAIRVCNSISNALTFLDYRELFDFSEDGSLVEMWVNHVGDLYKFKHKKHMISQKISGGDVVYLFSGAYKLSSDGKDSISLVVGDVGNTRFGVDLLPTSQLAIHQNQEVYSINSGAGDEDEKPPGFCSPATVLWKTESRAYCRSESQAGCSKSAAKTCIDMQTQKVTERD